MRIISAFVFALGILISPAAAQISCGQFDFATPFAESFASAKPYADAHRAAETITTLADGACHQDRLLKIFAERYGAVVGYKAAATSPGAQKQLGLSEPVLGVLFADMLHHDGATVPIAKGARLIFELDLLARVADPALTDATTREEALSGIDALIPFIELGDLMVPKGAAVTGPLLQAMNAGTRAGIVGSPVPVDGLSEADIVALSGVLAADGTVVARSDGAALLGHPLDAVLWIAKAAKARGMTLKTGDVLSLGSMGPLQLAAASTVTAHYVIGDREALVSVTLE